MQFIITIYLVYLIYAREQRRRILEKYTQLTHSPRNYLTLSSYPTDATYQIWLGFAY